MNMKDRVTYAVISILMASGLLVAAPAFAQTQTQNTIGMGGGYGMHRQFTGARPAVVGQVSAISGTTVTITSKMPMGRNESNGSNSSGTSYTVDASNASVVKDGATSTVTSIAVGDTVMVQGTLSGTSVTATKIYDGIPHGQKNSGAYASIQGNGEPVIGGSISAISGNTLTVTNKSNVTYTVDATNAKIVQGNATSALASLATGDNVIVQGAVNGNAVAASLVIDQAAVQGTSSGAAGNPHGMGMFMGAIGGFIHNLFGFF
ncbi:MAG: DUF5666 domain-containing protein [Candidatus Pacebacteria bacterium]|nr:DUF5666 domain-containing protein [Candidatus Paceibacterota bacterium]